MQVQIETKKYYLYQSMVFYSREECLITTILGSCISVCLWDPYNEIGGMNHYVLPFWNADGLLTPRYGNIAIPKLIQKMLNTGCRKSNLKAKIFGGADTLFNAKNGDMGVGARNIMLAEDMLNAEGIPIISTDIGGNCGRRIQFNTKTGIVKVRRFKSNQKI